MNENIINVTHQSTLAPTEVDIVMNTHSNLNRPLVYTVAQLAQYLGIGKNTAYTLVNDGTIPSVRVGRQIRISRAAVEEFLHTPQAG